MRTEQSFRSFTIFEPRLKNRYQLNRFRPPSLKPLPQTHVSGFYYRPFDGGPSVVCSLCVLMAAGLFFSCFDLFVVLLSSLSGFCLALS